MAAGGSRAFAWQVFPPMPTCRVYGTVAHQDGHLLVLGGCGRAGLPLDTAETLDMASHTWLALAPLPTARAGAAAVVLGKQVLVVGGVDEGQSPVAAVEAFLADEGRWEHRATLPQAAMGIAAVERGEWLPRKGSWCPNSLRFPLVPSLRAGARTVALAWVPGTGLGLLCPPLPFPAGRWEAGPLEGGPVASAPSIPLLSETRGWPRTLLVINSLGEQVGQSLGSEPDKIVPPHTSGSLRWTKASLAWGQLPWKRPADWLSPPGPLTCPQLTLKT